MVFENQPNSNQAIAYSLVTQSERMTPQPGYYNPSEIMLQSAYYSPNGIAMQQAQGISLQPSSFVQWMQRPSPIPGVPVGLE